MSVHVISWVLRNSPEAHGRRHVLIVLADHADGDGNNAFPSVATIAAESRLSERAVQKALRDLEEAGAIRSEGTSQYGTNRYTVLMDHPVPPDPSEVRGRRNDRGVQDQTEIPLETAPEPSIEPSSSVSSTPTAKKTKAREVWNHYAETMNPRRKEPGEDDLKIINQALKYGEVEELKTAISACHGSDWHMKRGKEKNRRGSRHNSLGKILKPRPTKGETWRSRLDFWLDLWEEQKGRSSGESGGKGRYTRR